MSTEKVVYDKLFELIGENHRLLQDLDNRIHRIEAKMEENPDEKRLDKHSDEIDDLRERVVALETKTKDMEAFTTALTDAQKRLVALEAKDEERDKQYTNKLVKYTIIATIAASVVAVVLAKFI